MTGSLITKESKFLKHYGYQHLHHLDKRGLLWLNSITMPDTRQSFRGPHQLYLFFCSELVLAEFLQSWKLNLCQVFSFLYDFFGFSTRMNCRKMTLKNLEVVGLSLKLQKVDHSFQHELSLKNLALSPVT